jgi:hypothetical protein
MLDYLHADDAKFIGCLTASKYSSRQSADQAAVILPSNHLFLHIRGDTLDCGMPRSAADDAEPTAAVFNWYWPDVLG